MCTSEVGVRAGPARGLVDIEDSLENALTRPHFLQARLEAASRVLSARERTIGRVYLALRAREHLLNQRGWRYMARGRRLFPPRISTGSQHLLRQHRRGLSPRARLRPALHHRGQPTRRHLRHHRRHPRHRRQPRDPSRAIRRALTRPPAPPSRRIRRAALRALGLRERPVLDLALRRSARSRSRSSPSATTSAMEAEG